MASGELALSIALLVVNRADAFAIERARRAGIATEVIVWDRKRESREEYDARVLDAVAQSQPDVVLLLGWMHLLAPDFIAHFPSIVNIHPAYLPLDCEADTVEMPDATTIPAFRGAHAIRDAIRSGSRWYGATVHNVTDRVDRGQVIVRTAAPLDPAWTEADALSALRSVEHETLIAALRKLTNDLEPRD